MPYNKKAEASFGTIVAIIGSILVALGVAWLIAQNWHAMPSVIKIIVLVLATAAAFIIGSVLRTYDYQNIAKALFILGSLLYTLSIFLIAQIFNLSTSMQSNSVLFLLAWIGVVLVAYIFDSSASLIVGLANFLAWLTTQYLAFASKTWYSSEGSFGILGLIYLATGILLYGLTSLHNSSDHKFAGVYRWWTAFYFLALSYILSFEIVLPYLWAAGLSISSSLLIFILIFSIVSIIVFIFGTYVSFSNNTTSGKELGGILLFVALLILLISSAALVSSAVGSCYPKSCYDIKIKSECNNAQLINQVCIWEDGSKTGTIVAQTQQQGYCGTLDCYRFNSESECLTAKTPLICKWENTSYGARCSIKQCVDFVYNLKEGETISTEDWENLDRIICRSADLPNQVCDWINGGCNAKNCQEYSSESTCKNAPDKLSCGWSNGGCYTQFIDKCNVYNNNKDGCSINKGCKWQAGSYDRRDIPTSLWLIWIWANIVFIIVILGVIGYGTWIKSTKIVNLGIAAFVLDILTRYIGLLIDYWAYTGLAILFITGGVLLIGGGFLIEKWRRKLIAEVKEGVNQ